MKGTSMNYKLNNEQDWRELARQAKWSPSGLAQRCEVSLRTLERQFHQIFGQSPKTWLSIQRQNEAKELLQDHTPIKKAAALIGYAHASTFTREFKKQTGKCPSAWAKPAPPPAAGNNVA
jgi:AraC-like DNA-binding protein